jgi:uncharacterized membrane protein YfcA
MIAIEFTLIVLLVSVVAGVLGSILGLGGAVVVTPLLTIFLGIDIHFAIGASIVSIIATSSGAAAAYVKDKLTNIRVGMFLELGTTCGAIVGAALAVYANSTLLKAIFGIVLLISLVPILKKVGEDLPKNPELKGLAKRLSLQGSYTETNGAIISYNATRPGEGMLGMVVAGLLSGLLGIGSGAFKVLSMDLAMKLPMKVSTTTSNFMIGVTAAASAGIYIVRGDVDPFIVAPVALGILVGALIGSKLLPRTKNPTVRKIFAVVLAATALEMIAGVFGL